MHDACQKSRVIIALGYIPKIKLQSLSVSKVPAPCPTWPPLVVPNSYGRNLPATRTENTGLCDNKETNASSIKVQSRSGQPAFENPLGKKMTSLSQMNSEVLFEIPQCETFPYSVPSSLKKGQIQEGNPEFMKHLLCARHCTYFLALL